MGSLLIEYKYDGDADAWKASIQEFLQHIENDPKLTGKFRYWVFTRADGSSRVHVPSWDSEETLQHLRAQPFFTHFAKRVKELGGDSLITTEPEIGLS